MTPHNEAKEEDIANIVIMPGDPLRAKYIAENYLTDYKLVNSIRNMFAYTGYYKEKKLTVMASGMGMPSMGIYCYELYQFYHVDKIIRIGSCGTFTPDIKVLDIILVENSYTEGNFAYGLEGVDCHRVFADKNLNESLTATAKKLGINLISGDVLCSEVFDYYVKDLDALIKRFPKDLNIIGAEMESFALFYTAKYLNKKSACLLTVVDSHYKKQEISADERQNSLNTMIKVALEASLNI